MSEATKPADCGGNCESCGADCSSRQQDMHIPLNQYSTVRKVIGIVSGKGGVGKSLVTSDCVRNAIARLRNRRV